MVSYGFYYSSALAGCGLVLTWLVGWPWAIPCYILAAFCLYFFRDPDRQVPAGPVAVAPADGKVVAIVAQGPEAVRISIFLNIFDVHVTRSPVAGTIREVVYRPGRFLVASREEASAQNEQNTVTVDAGGTTVVFKQIAGLIARRVICWKKPGEQVRCGERIGLIKFGSRMDVLFGPEWELKVSAGERVKAGSSVIAARRS
jgi:phosphatidylserine decarboxylase